MTLGLVPMPRQCQRVIALPGEGLQFILLEHAIEMVASEIFSMYAIKHTNVICVTRNADLDATEGTDESDEDYREHMKRILKKRSRLAPVRLESERPLSPTLEKLLLKRLNLKPHQAYVTKVPLDMSYTWGLAGHLPEAARAELTNVPFTPQWPGCLDRNRRIIDQVAEKEVLLSYPYESMDAFVQLLREAANDPTVISIKITLYRLASQSHLAEALIAAAENGKEVTALFELRARFDESNNIEWSQRFEQAGCNVIYGFRDFKVHSKICCITRQTDQGLQHITQLGTGNYNEKTAKLYTDLSFITTDETFGRDATEFFRNMGLENTSDNYDIMWVAPLQIKPMILAGIDAQIERKKAGEPCGLFFKTNSITDKDVIEKIVEASQAGVDVTLFVRGISCIVPGLEGYTEHVRVVSNRGAPAGAQPHLRLRPARQYEGVPVQRRPHDAQHGQAHRDSLARPRQRTARADPRIPRREPERHRQTARAHARWQLHAAWRVRERRRRRRDRAVRIAGVLHQARAAAPPGGSRGRSGARCCSATLGPADGGTRDDRGRSEHPRGGTRRGCGRARGGSGCGSRRSGIRGRIVPDRARNRARYSGRPCHRPGTRS